MHMCVCMCMCERSEVVFVYACVYICIYICIVISLDVFCSSASNDKCLSTQKHIYDFIQIVYILFDKVDALEC